MEQNQNQAATSEETTAQQATETKEAAAEKKVITDEEAKKKLDEQLNSEGLECCVIMASIDLGDGRSSGICKVNGNTRGIVELISNMASKDEQLLALLVEGTKMAMLKSFLK